MNYKLHYYAFRPSEGPDVNNPGAWPVVWFVRPALSRTGTLATLLYTWWNRN